MAKQTINLGTAPTGAGGDDRRSAWVKAIANFNELYEALGVPTSGAIASGIAAPFPVLADPAAGGLMQYVANANGYYFKFYNGLLICVTWAVGYAAGVVQTKNWPHGFLGPVGVSHSVTPTTGYDPDITAWGTNSQINFHSPVSRAQNTIVLTGIGRWKQ